MSKLPPRKTRDKGPRFVGDHQKYISRITKTLYYSKFPKTGGLSLPVTELAAELFSEAKRGRSLDRLHCDDAAKISRNTCVSPCSLVLAILYLERLKKSSPEYLEKTSSSDLFLVSLMVSCKFLYDDGENDEVYVDEWAVSAGIPIKQLVQLEKDFLKAIDWKVYVNELTFWKKLTEIEKNLARKHGCQRGFFTYTELDNLLNEIELTSFLQCLTAISVILVASYTAALLTLLGSVLIVGNIPGTCIQSNNNHSSLPETLLPDEIKSDFAKTNPGMNILKTGILLASIKPYRNESENVQNVSWNWWDVPTLQWLSETSKIVDSFEIPSFDFGYFGYYLDTYVSKVKLFELEDQVHKATKTRIQDQLENSWHKEWTDTIDRGFYDTYFRYYVQNVRS